jgi:hypothetical protein
MKYVAAIALGLLCFGAAPAWAHHSLGSYITTSPRAIAGIVKTFEWTNPHSRLIIVVIEANGAVTEWNFEGASLGRLANAGLSRNSVVPGDKVVVTYGPRRDGKPGGLFVAVTNTANGKAFKLKRDPNFKDSTIDGF